MAMALKDQTLAARIVAQSDLRAERLISILRMSLAAMLFVGVSYVISQTEIAGLSERQTELNFLRLGAVAYFTLGALNFYLSDARRFKPWMSWAFNFAEVAIVSFQLYVDVADPLTPSLMAFSSPVLLVVALVICVQALRFQVFLHLITCVLLLGLAGLVLFHDPLIGQPVAEPVISELQAVYSLPPNVMRMAMLAAMALLVGTAVYRSKRLVARVATETEIAENRKRFIPDEISESMSDLDIDALRSGQERPLAVLFVDIRGFTALSESLPPRETADLLSGFRSIVTDETLAQGGTVDKFIGDGALLIFGLHDEIPTAAKAALTAAEGIARAVDHWNAAHQRDGWGNLRLAMGLHAGPAIIGAIGDQRRLEFTAIGPTINLASRLEEVAKNQNRTLVVSHRVLDLAGVNPDAYTSLGPLALRGSAAPIEVYAH